jgi:hypothetical protein
MEDGSTTLPFTTLSHPKLKEETAHFIGSIAWKQGGDIRDVINVSKLVKKSDGSAEIE